MHVEDIARLSLNSIIHRRLRSFLTVLGIIIGIATVIALVSIGQGFQESVNSQLNQLGGNTLIITPGHQKAGGGFRFGGEFGGGSNVESLTENDVSTAKTVVGVEAVTGVVSGRVQVTFGGQNVSSSVIGIDPAVWNIMQQSTSLQSGRYLRDGDLGGVVVGSRIANDLFKKNISINSQLSISGKSFSAVGILQQTGGFGGGVSDNSVIVLKSGARSMITGLGINDVSTILVKVSPTANPNEVSSGIEQRLLLTHHVTLQNEDFTITSPQTIQQSISSITGTITLFLGSIAAISLLVGGIGVANTMFTSVMERTRQIGVLKSLGMTSKEVMSMFLLESALMGLIGGLTGTAVGMLMSGVISQIGSFGGGGGAASLGVARGGTILTYVSPDLVMFAVGFSTLVGALSGILPARRAARLQPVEALRYE